MQQIKFALSTTVLLFSLQATAQEPIDFSGVWQMDPSRSESAHQATPIGTFTLVIKQAATELSIETRRSERHKPAISSETLTLSLTAPRTRSKVTTACRSRLKRTGTGRS